MNARDFLAALACGIAAAGMVAIWRTLPHLVAVVQGAAR